jgi:hypothetical protein
MKLLSLVSGDWVSGTVLARIKEKEKKGHALARQLMVEQLLFRKMELITFLRITDYVAQEGV